jgi:hypothetical protein
MARELNKQKEEKKSSGLALAPLLEKLKLKR